MLLYFGHPVNTYDTDLERILLDRISIAFPGYDIENPNQGHHQENYVQWRSCGSGGMNYFKNEVLPKCVGGVFLPFRDGMWGGGVFMEAKWFLTKGMPVWEIKPSGIVRRINTIAPSKRLNYEDTCRRLYDGRGTTEKPILLPY